MFVPIPQCHEGYYCGFIISLESASRSVVSDSLWPHGLYSPWNSPGQNTGVGNLSLLQGIFPTRDQTQVSCIAGGFFTSWASRELLLSTNKWCSLFLKFALAVTITLKLHIHLESPYQYDWTELSILTLKICGILLQSLYGSVWGKLKYF